MARLLLISFSGILLYTVFGGGHRNLIKQKSLPLFGRLTTDRLQNTHRIQGTEEESLSATPRKALFPFPTCSHGYHFPLPYRLTRLHGNPRR